MEYLNFLVDGMHEDINLIKRKVEIPTPSSEGKDLLELALESWSISLRRDWSFIFFMLHGQKRTTLKCLNCSYDTSTYETFSNLPLRLYEQETVNLQILV
jgi:ubiquitin C-terminal hydrolase